MTVREVVTLGTASQAPTRTRNHNGSLLRWDGEGLLFDPGEGTQERVSPPAPCGGRLQIEAAAFTPN